MVKVLPAIVMVQVLDVVSIFSATAIEIVALPLPLDGETETKLQLLEDVQGQLATLVRLTVVACCALSMVALLAERLNTQFGVSANV